MTSADEQQSGSPDGSTGPADDRIRVAVVFGGRSGEHAVSCLSAASVLEHLDRQQFQVSTIGITPEGEWRSVDAASLREVGSGRFPVVAAGRPVSLRLDAAAALTSTGPDPERGPVPATDTPTDTAPDTVGDTAVENARVDVIFPVLHGPQGEDGTIQGLFEMAGIPYVGAGVLASAAGMDKEFTKKLLAAEGLPVGSYAVLRPGQATLPMSERERLGLPVFVKPARAGSSLGVSRVDDWGHLDDAVHVARKADPKVLVEAAVAGREIECGVLEHPDGTVQASPTAEIHLSGEHEFYDFDAKYVQDAATFDIPADLDPELEQQIRDIAVRAFRALDVQGLARVDFFVPPTGDGAGPVIINEVNTMPGFTPISMYPRVFRAAGIEYPELLATLIGTALARGTGLR